MATTTDTKRSWPTSHLPALACFARGDLDFLWARTKTPAEDNTEIMLKFYKRFNSLFLPTHTCDGAGFTA
jgi:hypothetical protein